jgi:hypothetical protein
MAEAQKRASSNLVSMPTGTNPPEPRPHTSRELAKQLLAKFVSLTQKASTPLQGELWADLLGDVSPDLLTEAGKRLMLEWHFPNLPMPGDVIRHVENIRREASIGRLSQSQKLLEHEQAWQRSLDYVAQYYYPDSGLSNGAPKLSPSIQHAIKAAGGYAYLESCSNAQLVWAKKTFIADLENVNDARSEDHLLGDSEAKEILGSLFGASRESRLLAK